MQKLEEVEQTIRLKKKKVAQEKNSKKLLFTLDRPTATGNYQEEIIKRCRQQNSFLTYKRNFKFIHYNQGVARAQTGTPEKQPT